MFSRFEYNLDLGVLDHGSLPNKLSTDNNEVKLFSQFLIKKNDELFNIIDEYNEARSLSPRQASIKALNQKDDNEELGSANNASSRASNDTTGNNPLVNNPSSSVHE